MTTNVEKPFWQTDSLPSFRIWYVLLILPVIGMIAFAVFQPIQVLPRVSLAPGFAFTDQDTTETLRAYADGLDADTSVLHFVTGGSTLLKSVIGAGFCTYYDLMIGKRMERSPSTQSLY